MPIYEYDCGQCGVRTEAIQRMGEKPLKICPHCGGKLKKAFSAPAIQFKGSGFYVTDYARSTQEGGSGKSDKHDKAEKSERAEKTEKSGEKAEKAEKSEKSEKTEKTEKSEKASKLEKTAKKPSKSDR